jgi:AcrR family transcriptional regulator
VSSKSTAKSLATRSRILDAALALFNEHGTAAVSGNQVAAAAGLSSGNLYYHFADKQEIIRELHGRFAAEHEVRWRAAPDRPADVTALRRAVAEGADLAWRYRFFEREILALLRADERLRADYRAVYRRRLEQWQEFALRLVDAGLVRPPRPPSTLAHLATAVWLIAENWLAFRDLLGEPDDPGAAADGADLVLVALDPYLTARGRRQWQGAAPQTAVPKAVSKQDGDPS